MPAEGESEPEPVLLCADLVAKGAVNGRKTIDTIDKFGREQKAER
jgi:hypothetical protein